MKIKNPSQVLTCLLAVGLTGPTLSAQSVDLNVIDEEEVVNLPEFVVRPDLNEGYVATNTISGTRLNERIKELPIPVEIITEEFIDDIGALTIKDALNFTAGLETVITSQQVGENTSNPNAFRLRGYVSEAVLRNGFRVIGATDTSIVTQVDVVRGPNALLYGIGNFGGVVNYVTQSPSDVVLSEISFNYGSWEFVRCSAKARGPIVQDKLGFVTGAFYQENNRWYDIGHDEKWGANTMLEYKPFPSTTLVLEGDYIESRARNPENPLSEAFEGAPIDAPFIDTTEYPQTIVGGSRDGQPTNKGFLRFPSREFRWSGADALSLHKDTSLFAIVRQNFGQYLSFQGGYNFAQRKRYEFDDTLSLSSGLKGILNESQDAARLRAAYPWMYIPQHPQYEAWHEPDFNALQYNFTRNENEETRHQIRAEFAFRAPLGKTQQTLIAGMTYSEFFLRSTNYGFKDTSRPQKAPSSDDTTAYQGAYARYQSIYNLEPIRYRPSATEGFYQLNVPLKDSKFWEKGYYFIHQMKFWKERFQSVLGVRYDWIHTATAERWDYDDEGFSPPLLGTLKGYNHRADGPSTQWNFSTGLSYTPIEQLSFFILRASALQPVYNQTTAEGVIPNPTKGLSYELGVKFEFLARKISGAVSFYQIERTGVVVDTSNKVYGGLNGNDATSDPDWVAQGRGPSRPRGFKDDQSQGVDLQVFFTDFFPGFEIVLNFSYNKYNWERTYGPSFLRKDGVGKSAIFVFAQEDFSDQINRSRLNNDVAPYSVKIWNKYTFKTGVLRGLNLGLGLIWTDRREATFSAFRADDSFKVIPDRLDFSAALGYKRKLRYFDLNLQLNIYNLLDDDTVYGYSYTTPRNLRLQAIFKF